MSTPSAGLALEGAALGATNSTGHCAGVALDASGDDAAPAGPPAALFAFRSPFSKSAVLPDEVGLGKTIEAGQLPAQR